MASKNSGDHERLWEKKLYIYIHTYTYIYIYIDIYIYIYIHIYIYIYIYMHTHIHIYNIHIHTHIHIHTYTYTHTHIHNIDIWHIWNNQAWWKHLNSWPMCEGNWCHMGVIESSRDSVLGGNQWDGMGCFEVNLNYRGHGCNCENLWGYSLRNYLVCAVLFLRVYIKWRWYSTRFECVFVSDKFIFEDFLNGGWSCREVV